MTSSLWQLALDADVLAIGERAVSRCDRLPVMDRAVQRVLALTADEDCDLGELVAALEADPALSINVMRYANSAHAGRPIRAKSVRQAVVMIGRHATRQLCLEAVTFRFFETAVGNGRVSRGAMHIHAVSVAKVAAATAELVSIPPDFPHLAGLLHDCGKLVMPIAFGENEMDAIATEHPSGVARSKAEWDRFGLDHAYAGALFASQSGLDEDLVAAIAWHHGGRRGCVAPTPQIACVQIANTVVGMLAGERPDETLLDEMLGRLELEPDALDALAESAGAAQVGSTAPSATGPTGLGDRVAQLERLASTDELTALANRRHWMASVKSRLDSGEPGSVLLCDLDRFKQVNDTHGHAAGDAVLCQVARMLEHYGFAGRIGGDEFALWVAAEAGLTAAGRLIEDVKATFGQGRPPTIGVSIGVADGISDLSDALQAADQALYSAKQAGRGRAFLAADAAAAVAG